MLYNKAPHEAPQLHTSDMDALSNSKTISFTVTYRGVTHHFSQPFDCPLVDFQAQLEELLGVPPSLQKLLYKGKKTTSDDTTLALAGFKNGLKIQMLGTTTQELDGMKLVEGEQRRRERILRERALKTPVKVRMICFVVLDGGLTLACHSFVRRVQAEK